MPNWCAWCEREAPCACSEALRNQKAGLQLDLVSLADVELETIEWIWRNHLARGKFTLLIGDPGMGKSLMTQTWATILSRGWKWPDGEQAPKASTIIFSTEDGLADTVAPRLAAAGADMSRVFAIRRVLDAEAPDAERMFAFSEHLALLEQAVVEKEAGLLIWDPMSAYLGPDVNANRESDVRRILGPVSLMLERTRVSGVGLMHMNKGSGVQALYRSLGSIAFPAVARIVLGVAPDINDPDGRRRALLPLKINIAIEGAGTGYRIERVTRLNGHVLPGRDEKDQPPVLLWDREPVLMDAQSAMNREGTREELRGASEAKTVLLQFLADNSWSAPANACKEEIRKAGFSTSEGSLTRARQELGIRARKEGNGHGAIWYWELGHRSEVSTEDSTPESWNLGVLETLKAPEAEGSNRVEPSDQEGNTRRLQDSKAPGSRAREGEPVPLRPVRCEGWPPPCERSRVEHSRYCMACLTRKQRKQEG